MSNNPNHFIEWPKCWSTKCTKPSIIGWDSNADESKRKLHISYATQIAYMEITEFEKDNHGHR